MQSENKYPPLVYKYRNWTDQYHKDLLLKNELFFTSPKDFNDPFDCRIPYDYSFIATEDRIKAYINKKREDHKDESTFKGNDLEKILKDFENRLRNEPNQIQKQFNDLYFDGVDKHFGVLSLSERWNSILMWSHYADNHKGYCIGFWEEKLRNSFIATGGRVIYPPQNYFPRIDPMGDFLENMIRQSHTKSSEWNYEKEYRLAKIFYPQIARNEERIQKFPDEFISEIIIGLNASQQTRDDLLQIGRQKNINVYKAVKSPFKFELTKETIL